VYDGARIDKEFEEEMRDIPFQSIISLRNIVAQGIENNNKTK